MSESIALKVREVYQGVEKVSAGYKMLAAMGWQEGDGLGANKQGMKTHIKAVKKFDSSGVGATAAVRRAQDWTIGMNNFTDMLGGLREVKSAPDFSAYAESSSSEEESDDDAAASESDAESSESSDDDAVEVAPDVENTKQSRKRKAEEALDAEIQRSELSAKKRVQVASHSGRYTKRELNKRVTSYSATDLAAILGQKSSEDVAEHRMQSGGEADGEAEAAAKTAKAAQRTRAEQESAIVSVEPQPGDDTAWWRLIFHRAGIVGKTEKALSDTPSRKKINVHGFSEADQTALYTRTQDLSTKGRKGLGQNRAGKAADAEWAGKKTRIVDSDDDEDDAEDEALDEEDADCDAEQADTSNAESNSDTLPGGATIVWAQGIRPAWFLQRHNQLTSDTIDNTKKGSDVDDAVQEVIEPRSSDPQVPEESLNSAQRRVCRKATKKVLKADQTGSMKVKKLIKHLRRELVSEGNSDTDLEEKIASFLKGETAFQINKSSIRLSA